MTIMRTSRFVITAAFVVLGGAILAPEYFPHAGLEWLRYIAAVILLSPIGVLFASIARAVRMGIQERSRDRKAVQKAPTSNGIQVLGTFLGDDTSDHYGQGGAR